MMYALGDDDTHDITKASEVCHNLTMVNTGSLDPESVYNALDLGLCYAVEFDNWYHHPMTLSEKVEQARALPHLTRAELVGDTLFVATSNDKMQEVKEQQGIYFDMLVETIDSTVEKCTNYEQRVKQQYALV